MDRIFNPKGQTLGIDSGEDVCNAPLDQYKIRKLKELFSDQTEKIWQEAFNQSEQLDDKSLKQKKRNTWKMRKKS